MRQLVLLSTIAIIAGGLASPAAAQQVVRQSNGELNVEFPGPCTVHYNRNLTLESVDRSCTSYQRQQAERPSRRTAAAIRAIRRSRAIPDTPATTTPITIRNILERTVSTGSPT